MKVARWGVVEERERLLEEAKRRLEGLRDFSPDYCHRCDQLQGKCLCIRNAARRVTRTTRLS